MLPKRVTLYQFFPIRNMKDFVSLYAKSTFRKNIAIACAAFVLAVGVNAFLFGTDAGVKIQTSAIGYAGNTKKIDKSDIYFTTTSSGSDILKLKVSKAATAAKEIRATIVFDSKKLAVKDVFTTNKNAEIVKSSTVDGILLVNIRYITPENIAADSEIATVVAVKSSKEKAPVNLVGTQLVTADGMFELTNEAVEY